VKGSLLTDFEFARCMAAIEAVDRLGKPAAEVGPKRVPLAQRGALTEELRRIVASMGVAEIREYVSRSEAGGWVTFGFYRFGWVRDALEFLEREAGSLDERTRGWVQGLVFGYRPEAIEGFLSASSASPGSGPRSRPVGISRMAGRSR
jgi:hypothetical protein